VVQRVGVLFCSEPLHSHYVPTQWTTDSYSRVKARAVQLGRFHLLIVCDCARLWCYCASMCCGGYELPSECDDLTRGSLNALNTCG